MAMPEYTPAPAPSKAEFDSLASDVSTLNGNLANKVPYQTPTSDCNTFEDGITIVSSTNNVSNLPESSRCAVLQFTLLSSPLRRLQYAFVIDTMKIYVRSYSGSWSAWSSFALDS